MDKSITQAYSKRYKKIYRKVSYFLLILLMITIPIYSFYQFYGVSLSRIMPFILLLNIIWSAPLFLKIKKTQIEILLTLFLFLIYVAISISLHWDLYGITCDQRYFSAPIGYTFILSDLVNFALFVFLFLRFYLLPKEKQVFLLRIFCFSVLILNLFGLVLYGNIVDGRMLGGTENPNTMGQDMAISFLFIVFFIPALQGNVKLNLQSKILAIIFLVLCISSGSRSALLFLIFPFFLLFLIKKKKIAYFGLFVIILSILFLVIWAFSLSGILDLTRLIEEGRTIGTETRWITWSESIQSWQEAPFFGKGWRLLFDKPSHWWPHNTLLWILESLGIVGFLIFSLFYFQVFGVLYQKWQRASLANRQCALICLIIFLDITFKGLIGDIFTNRAILMLVGIIMGLIYFKGDNHDK